MALVDLLLNRLKAQNPAGYKFVMEVKQSGRNPYDVLHEMYSNGQINDAQLNQLQQQGRMFGVRITNDDIAKIKGSKQDIKPTNNGKFGGWF